MAASGVDDIGAAPKNEASNFAVARRFRNSSNCLQKVSTIWGKLSTATYHGLGHRVGTIEAHAISREAVFQSGAFERMIFSVTAREEDQYSRHVGENLILDRQRTSLTQKFKMRPRLKYLAGFATNKFFNPVDNKRSQRLPLMAKAENMCGFRETKNLMAGKATLADMTLRINIANERRPRRCIVAPDQRRRNFVFGRNWRAISR